MAASRHQRHIVTVGYAAVQPESLHSHLHAYGSVCKIGQGKEKWPGTPDIKGLFFITWRRGVCVAGVVSSWHSQRGAGCRASSWKAYLGNCWRMKGQTWQSRQPNGSWARGRAYIDERTTLSKTGDDNRLSLTVIWWNFRISDKAEIHNIYRERSDIIPILRYLVYILGFIGAVLHKQYLEKKMS